LRCVNFPIDKATYNGSWVTVTELVNQFGAKEDEVILLASKQV